MMLRQNTEFGILSDPRLLQPLLVALGISILHLEARYSTSVVLLVLLCRMWLTWLALKDAFMQLSFLKGRAETL